MKTQLQFFILLLVSFLATSLIGQSRELNEAARKSPNRDGVYYAHFNKPASGEDINAWMIENEYRIVGHREARNGNGYVIISFITLRNYRERKRGEAAADKMISSAFSGLGNIWKKSKEQMSNASNESYSSSTETACYSNFRKSGMMDSGCSNGRTAVYKVKCKDGETKTFYYCSNGVGGYYEFRLSGQDVYLAKDRAESLKELCDCN